MKTEINTEIAGEDDVCARLLTELMHYAQKLEAKTERLIEDAKRLKQQNGEYKLALYDAEDRFRDIARTDDFYEFLSYVADNIRDITDQRVGVLNEAIQVQ